MSTRNFKRNFFIVAGADAVKRIAEWIKQKFYTKAEIDDMLSAGMKYKVVNELPATGEAGTFYLVPKQSAGTGDVYDEWIWLPTRGTVTAHFEHIGSTEIDLSNYYTKTEADDLLDDKVDKVAGKGLSTEDYTTAEKTKLAGVEAGAEVNVQSDWNQSDSTKDDYIKNKPTLRQPSADGTAGQYLKSNGSGNAPSWETMDTAPTANSTKAVTSGGVKTALDGKQASVTITTNANTPTDNDTVIMQDSGNTGTTSFLRRKLSTLWDYIKGKADGVYVPFEWIVTNNDNFSGSGGKHLYNLKIDDGFFGANKRWSVTREIFDIESGELVTTQNVSQLFDGNFERLFTHPIEGEKEVITITPASGATSLKTYFSGKICLHFYNIKEPLSATLKISVKDTPTTFQTYSFAPYRGKIWCSENFNLVYPHTVIVEIIGKSYTGDGQWVATSLTEMSYFGTRNTIGDESALVKHEIAQEMFGNLTAPKFITKGGTSSQYLRGDGSLTTLSTSPTSGSGLPITSGAVYTALGSKQNKFLTFDVPDNAGFATLTLISDITESLSTPSWTGHGIIGFMYGWRAGNISGSTAQRITCWGNHDTSYVKLQTDNNNNNALKPLLVYYNSRYYLALKKNKRSGMTHYFIGYSQNLLSTYINLYANSNESKWYSDSGRTTEVTFTITKDYSRYEGGYLDFMGNSSQVVLGTGELKTIDSSVASGSSNLVTSGAVYTAINSIDTSGKVNLQPDFTASQIDYSAGNVGKWQKVLRFPEGADLVINMKKTAMGSDATSTLWFSSSSMGDSYTSLFGNHSVRFVHDGGYVFLVLACASSTNEPIESYTFQIAHSSVPMSDIVAVTDASPITATPKEPNIVYRAPITTGAVSFNVTSGAGSVYMSGHNDFLGNMTSEASNGVVVTMSGATEGQIYRFVFTRNITGGVTFKQSNVAYCTIQGDVNAGDTITLTAVSNTADGWLYEQESAGIKSSDGSINVEYDGGIADLSINIPPDVVRNNEWTSSVGHKVIAIGDGASADTVSNNVAIGKEADASGNSAVCVGGNSEASGNYSSSFGYNAEASAFGAVAIGGNAVANGSGAVAIGGNQPSQTTISAGYSVAIGGRAIAPSNSVAIGHNANGGTGSYGTTIGKDAESSGSNTCAVGYGAKAQNTNAIAVGSFANANQMKGEYGKHELVQFKVNDESKKVYTSSTAETISIEITGIGTFAGIDIPANNMLFVLSEELEFANELLFEVDGIMKQKQSFSSSALNYILSGSKIALGSSGLYAYKFSCGNIDYSDINSSANAYFFATSGNSYDRINGISIGRRGVSIGSESIAIGVGATSIRDGQIVVGRFNAESGTDLMQVGNGTESNRKNILTIDSNERLNVSAYVGGTQTIDMNQQTGSLGNITKSIYRIRWDDTGTINLTLGTGGCVEGQRVTIFAETNDVQIRFTSYLIPEGQFADFMFIAGAWRPYSGIGRVPTA
jgi:hypothetical protein